MQARSRDWHIPGHICRNVVASPQSEEAVTIREESACHINIVLFIVGCKSEDIKA